MQSKLSGLALVVSLAAVGVGAYAVTKEREDPSHLEERLIVIEEQVARIERALESREPGEDSGPYLLGRSLAPARSGAPAAAATETELAADGPRTADAPAGKARDPERAAEEIRALVDKAVEKKAKQIERMRNKKPSIDVFAETLALNDQQRRLVERDVVQAQQEIRTILEIPAADGTNFLDELVEVMAQGMANPGKNPGRGMRLFGRIMSEKIPGTDETYAARIETVKGGLRQSFKSNFDEKQYATFETWRMDPSEVQDIPGSPWEDLEVRIVGRARDLGAEIPEEDDEN